MADGDEVEGGTSSTDAAPKSKAQLRAERRELQERQRKLKEEKKKTNQDVQSGTLKKGCTNFNYEKNDASNYSSKSNKITSVSSNPIEKAQSSRNIEKKALSEIDIRKKLELNKKVHLFSHLPQHNNDCCLSESQRGIHSDVVELGKQCADNKIIGSNARCVEFLRTLKKFIQDYSVSPRTEMSRDLCTKLDPNIKFLSKCRPLSVGMKNCMKSLKLAISKLEDVSESEAKKTLIKHLDAYLHENITLAGESISSNIRSKIKADDVIVVHAYSSLVEKVLKDAHESNIKFRVIIVDSRPKLEGKHMLDRLTEYGIQCSYVLSSSVSYMMQEASMVVLGAHALLANGNMMSRTGASQIALIARSRNVPVIVCCETYKFCERVQTDSFVFNELGDPNDLVSQALSMWTEVPLLGLLNLNYDVTPADLIDLVVTELGMMPCTSVPVVLRLKQIFA